MSRDSPVDRSEGAAPEAAFALLGDETRLAILRALWRAQVETGGAPIERRSVSFAELRERVGVRDSGRFNYHLGKLVGPFVRKSDDGYSLRRAGMQVVGAVLAGAYDRAGALDPLPLDDPCPGCGSELRLRYEEERVTVGCVDCEEFVLSFGLPPGVLEGYDRADLPALVDRWLKVAVERVHAGFCLVCAGRTVGRVVTPETVRVAPDRESVHAEYVCERCGDSLVTSLPAALLFHPAVVAFHHDHGVDVRAVPTWRLDWYRADANVAADDPPQFAAEGTLEGETLRVVVDEELAVVSSERRGGGTA